MTITLTILFTGYWQKNGKNEYDARLGDEEFISYFQKQICESAEI